MHAYSCFSLRNVWVVDAIAWLHRGAIGANHDIMQTSKIVTTSTKKNLKLSLMTNKPQKGSVSSQFDECVHGS